MISVKQNADTFGAFASTLCLIHCVATPFVFIAHSCTKTCCSATPVWWQSVDYLFLGISFLAIRKTVKETSSDWMKPAMWLSWVLLLIVILNESTAWFPLHENAIYIPSLLLVFLHLYNRKYCQCNKHKCCSNG